MKTELHEHARARLAERGATEEEARATVEEGEESPAKFGRVAFRRNFRFEGTWRGRSYAPSRSRP